MGLLILITCYRTAGAIILNMSHGYQTKEHDDPVVQCVDTATDQFSAATAPGAFLVDVIHSRASSLLDRLFWIVAPMKCDLVIVAESDIRHHCSSSCTFLDARSRVSAQGSVMAIDT
jgi:hypothetical protein